jgi:hypothetical protein
MMAAMGGLEETQCDDELDAILEDCGFGIGNSLLDGRAVGIG